MSVFRDHPELLSAFREGRREALERVYRAYVREVDAYLRAQARAAACSELGHASAIADIVQEVFIRAFSAQARRGFDGLRDFGPYLTAIARNCFVDALRARGREVLKAPEQLSLIVDEPPAEVPRWCEPTILSVLTAYLRELPADLNGVYEQRFTLGQSQEEASAALGISRRTLRTAETHLRRGLRQALIRAGISLREPQAHPPPDFSTRIAAPAVVVGKGRL
jgi:RNA polymerase sigma-70 factor (ECF subfamily)